MQNLKNLDWQEVLEKISSSATSARAKQCIQDTQELEGPIQAENRFKEITEAQNIVGQGVRPFFESLDLFDTWFVRLKKNAVLRSIEIKDVRHFLMEALAFKELLKSQAGPWAVGTTKKLMAAEEPLSAIEAIFTSGGEIRSDASETLYQLYREKELLTRQISQSLDRLVKSHDLEHMLQDRFVTTREGRWVIPVRGGSQHFVKGMIHGHSQSKQTVYIEPEEVIPANNRLRQVEWEVEQEIERILTELSQYLSSLHTDFTQSEQLMLDADIKFAHAQFARKTSATACAFSDNEIYLKELKHPLLALSYSEVISNTVSLNEERSILLLTGPNAGGKTVLLKAIGLASQMARCGIPICAAPESKLPFFKNLHLAIGDSQSVDEHLSTFAAHLKILNEATKLSNYNSLLLIDEICGSTDPDEGSALARSFIEAYAKNKIFSVITSHLGPLKVGWRPESHVLQGSLQYNEKTGKPTYQFLSGLAGDSLALQTAKRVGVHDNILTRAYELLSPEMRAKHNALEELESMKANIRDLQEDLKKQKRESEKIQQKYTEELKRFESQKQNELNKFLKSAKKDLEEKIQAAQVQDTFKRFQALQEIKQEMPEIVKATPPDEVATKILSAQDFAERFPPGTKVFIPSLGQDGIIQGTPNSKGEIPVLSHSLRLFVSWKDLRPPDKPTSPTAKILRQKTSFAVGLHEQDRVLDIRGKNLENSLGELEIALDQAVRNKEDRIKVIHGHGTETLKRGIRAYLSRSVYVTKWKAGTPESGGDGITWVEIGEG